MTQLPTCPDCQRVDRRDFVRIGGAALAGAAASAWSVPSTGRAAPTPASAAETVVGRLYASLSEKQKGVICLPFDHQGRRNISANWHVTEATIGDDLFSDEQRALIDQIVRQVTSEDGYERLQRQMDEDDGGMENYSIAIFGEPGAGKFQWEMTGRHLTMRADGNSVDRAAFGGPIVYGHGEEDPKQNLFYYQTQQANEVFAALDPKQRERALLKNAPAETKVQVQGPRGKFPGIAVSELAQDQQQLVAATLKVLLAPYRQEDVEEVMALLKAGGGLEQLRMAFYQEQDLQDDGVWDIWRVEGPSLVWHFRGAPHVHAYINIALI
jgi:hypothetical protein